MTSVKYADGAVFTDIRMIDFPAVIAGLSQAKRRQLWAAAQANPDIDDFINMVRINPGPVNKAKGWVQDGLSALVADGLVSQGAVDNL